MWRYTEQPVFGTKANHIQSFIFIACTSFALAALIHLTIELPFAGLWSMVSKRINRRLKNRFHVEPKSSVEVKRKETDLWNTNKLFKSQNLIYFQLLVSTTQKDSYHKQENGAPFAHNLIPCLDIVSRWAISWKPFGWCGASARNGAKFSIL